MEVPEIVEFARNFAVMVRAQGPDPKGLKMQKHAFHHYSSGKTTISASGMLLPDSCRGSLVGSQIWNDHVVSTLVVTVASVVEPFVLPQHRENSIQGFPELIPGAQIDVMLENKVTREKALEEPNDGSPPWIPTKVLALVEVPASTLALQSLIEASSGATEGNSWEVGWSLALLNNGSQSSTNVQVEHDLRINLHNGHHRQSGSSKSSTIRIAFLEVPSVTSLGLPKVTISNLSKRGDILLAMGSPFGVLSPAHFFNSISMGSISNFCPSSSYSRSLLMADIRCLPGMEGGPVFSKHAHFIGIMSRPLRQRVGGAEVQLVIPWEVIALAQSELLQIGARKSGVIYNKEGIHTIRDVRSSNSPEQKCFHSCASKSQEYDSLSAPQITRAMASIVLITIDDGTWASGVVLNSGGLILTNAHLLEPWRFTKTDLPGGNVIASDSIPLTFKKDVSMWQEENEDQKERQNLLPDLVRDAYMSNMRSESKVGSLYSSFKRIRVRLDHVRPCTWCDARVVYISQGPLDVALLQLESFPKHASPIIPDLTCPVPGSKAYVIGHGLFGPRSELGPSICSGVVARIVKAPSYLHPIEPSLKATPTEYLAAMLETTAAVYAGGSGGAVVNSDGHMIGLVTSNAKHGGGTVIPQLNFSIPSAALELIFKFAQDMEDKSILQHLDKPNEHLSSIWALMPPLSPRQVPPFLYQPKSLPDADTKEKKGSRFAKFIAERNGEVFIGPKNLIKAGKPSNEILPSKL